MSLPIEPILKIELNYCRPRHAPLSSQAAEARPCQAFHGALSLFPEQNSTMSKQQRAARMYGLCAKFAASARQPALVSLQQLFSPDPRRKFSFVFLPVCLAPCSFRVWPASPMRDDD